MKVHYRSNNSGGRWWLDDEHWHALERAGWDVEWVAARRSEDEVLDKLYASGRERGRWLGALAMAASKDFETPADAMREFEQLTGQDVSDEGCNCCGPPHNFSWEAGEKVGYASGEECLEHLFEDVPASLREALERRQKRESS